MRIQQFGVVQHDSGRAQHGVTLVTPMLGRNVYLVGMKGEVLHRWNTPLRPNNYAYLLPNGNLLWAGKSDKGQLLQGGFGGVFREYDWDGNVVWSHDDPAQHHDFRRLPNGNTIYLGWMKLDPALRSELRGGAENVKDAHEHLWGDYVREVTPAGETAWEWRAHEGLPMAQNPLHPIVSRDEYAHANTCMALPNGDVLVVFRRLNTVIIIDRSTGKVRWSHRDDSWGQPHDAQMLENGNILLFANGLHVASADDLPASRVVEFDPATGKTVWEYVGAPAWTLFSPHISGCQRLPNGNTLICEGLWGRLIEVTTGGEIVWEYVSPFFGPHKSGGPGNWLFRAHRYTIDSPEIRNRVHI